MSISWSVAVEDHASGPANAMAKAMGEAASKARGMNDEAHHLSNAMHGAAEGMGHASEATEGLRGVWEVFEGTLLERVAEKAFEAVKDAILELPQAAIEATEQVERLTEVFGALSEGAGDNSREAGEAVFAMVRKLSQELPSSERDIQRWTQTLMAAGVTDMTQLEGSLRATAGAEALVAGGGERVQSLLGRLFEMSEKGSKLRFNAQQLVGTGVTQSELLRQLGMTNEAFERAKKAGTLTGANIADAIVKVLGEKARGPLEAQMSELPTIIEKKGKEAFSHLLEGLDLAPLSNSLKDFFSIFDLANPSGQAMKEGIGGAMQFVVNLMGDGIRIGKDLFLHMVIWALEAAIAVKSFAKHWEEWKPIVLGVAAAIATALSPSIILMTVGFIEWAVSASAAAVATIAATWPLLAIAAAVGLVAFGIVKLIQHWDDVKNFFTTIGAAAVDAGKSLIDGFVHSIADGVDRVVNAAKKVGSAAVGALKSLLGIASPSRVMYELGAHVSEGMALGVESGADRVQDAHETLMPSTQSASPQGGNSVQNTFHIDVHIDAGHAATPAQLQGIVEEGFGSLASRLAAMIGSAPVPA